MRHVFDSRSLSFADGVREVTHGEGVQVVLNSLAGEFIPASLALLARGGRFIELGKRDILSPEEAARRRPDVRYHAFDLGAEAVADHALLRPMLEELCASLARGGLRPLPTTSFPLAEAAEAFRFMAQARHMGKLVLRAPAGTPPLFSAGATYWVTGGLGALGLETARWLVRSGARHLVLSGRRPPSPQARAAVEELERQGATVRLCAADAADRAAMERVLSSIAGEMPPLRGVFHAAGALDDGVLAEQRLERFRGVLAGKAEGAFVLHELTRGLPLDHFVLYSAAGLLLGAPGQGGYPAANAQLDALAQARRRAGLPALSVAWGAWAGAGMLAGSAAAPRAREVWAARGLLPITPALGFARLEQLLREGAAHAAVLPVDWARFLSTLPEGADRGFFRELGASRPRAPGAPAPGQRRAPRAPRSAPRGPAPGGARAASPSASAR